MIDLNKLQQVSEPNEEWKYLIDETKKVNTNFAVSNFGRIYSTKTNKIVKQYTNRTTKYNYFFLNDYGSKNFEIMHTHRAVALSFLGYPTHLKDDFPVVDHINEVKGDNRLSNLQWITHKENVVRETAIVRRVESLKKTIEIKHKFQEKDSLIVQLAQENQNLKKSVDNQAEQTISSYNEMIDKLKKENELFRKVNEEQAKELQQIKTEKNNLQLEYENIIKENSELKAKLEKFEFNYELAEAIFANVKKDVKQLQETTDNLDEIFDMIFQDEQI